MNEYTIEDHIHFIIQLASKMISNAFQVVAEEDSKWPPPSPTRQISHSPQIALHTVENKNGGTFVRLSEQK